MKIYFAIVLLAGVLPCRGQFACLITNQDCSPVYIDAGMWYWQGGPQWSFWWTNTVMPGHSVISMPAGSYVAVDPMTLKQNVAVWRPFVNGLIYGATNGQSAVLVGSFCPGAVLRTNRMVRVRPAWARQRQPDGSVQKKLWRLTTLSAWAAFTDTNYLPLNF